MIGAVVYLRVSDPRQVDNLSLDTQRDACDIYCARQGLTVREWFREEGESAKTADRPELQRLLEYCRTHKGTVQFVVVYNLTRFARETYDHFVLRAHLKSLGISLRSATEPIDDTSTGKLMEGVLAAFAQFDNDQRSARTKAGMKAALEMGRWTFLAPLGYLNAPKALGASLIPDPERAPLVQRVFREFASGDRSRDDVRQQLTAAGLRTRRGRPVPSQTFDDMLRNKVYVGVIDVPHYGVVDKRGDFEPLIDEATFYRVQAILTKRVQAAQPVARRHVDFPLRGFVRCARCSRGLTGSWSKGRSGYYAYYHCQDRCRAVNISKAALEEQFLALLAEYQPTAGFMRLVKAHVVVEWQELQADVREAVAVAARQVRTIQERLDRLDEVFLFQKAIDQESYTRQRDRLREELALARMNQHSKSLEEIDVEGILAFAEEALPNAARLWMEASLEQRQQLQRIFFSDGILVDGQRLVRTAATLPFTSKLGSDPADRNGVVDQTGPSWNHITSWLKDIDALRRIAA